MQRSKRLKVMGPLPQKDLEFPRDLSLNIKRL